MGNVMLLYPSSSPVLEAVWEVVLMILNTIHKGMLGANVSPLSGKTVRLGGNQGR